MPLLAKIFVDNPKKIYIFFDIGFMQITHLFSVRN